MLLLPAYVLAGSPQLAPRAFVTSASGIGDFSSWEEATPDTTGLEAADSICSNLASDARLEDPGDYVAWVSDSNHDAYCRVSGFSGMVANNCDQAQLPTSTGPWVRTDEVPWAGRIEDVVDPEKWLVYTPLNLDENGQQVAAGASTYTSSHMGQLFTSGDCSQWTSTATSPDFMYEGNYAVWTGTAPNGTRLPNHCDSWKSTEGDGIRGTAVGTVNNWSVHGSPTACSGTHLRLYCLSDFDPKYVFDDGFE